jgi:hypothetical protein
MHLRKDVTDQMRADRSKGGSGTGLARCALSPESQILNTPACDEHLYLRGITPNNRDKETKEKLFA